MASKKTNKEVPMEKVIEDYKKSSDASFDRINKELVNLRLKIRNL